MKKIPVLASLFTLSISCSVAVHGHDCKLHIVNETSTNFQLNVISGQSDEQNHVTVKYPNNFFGAANKEKELSIDYHVEVNEKDVTLGKSYYYYPLAELCIAGSNTQCTDIGVGGKFSDTGETKCNGNINSSSLAGFKLTDEKGDNHYSVTIQQ